MKPWQKEPFNPLVYPHTMGEPCDCESCDPPIPSAEDTGNKETIRGKARPIRRSDRNKRYYE